MVCTIKVGDKLLEMAKDLGIQHSVSSSPNKIWANFFHKKALHGETIYFGIFFFFGGGGRGGGGGGGRAGTWGLMIRSCKAGS